MSITAEAPGQSPVRGAGRCGGRGPGAGRDAVVGEVGRRAGRGGRPGPAAHLGLGGGRGRGGRRGRRPRPGQAAAALRLDRGLAHPCGRALPRRGETPSGPGQGVDRSAGPDPARPGRRGRCPRNRPTSSSGPSTDLPSGDLVRRRGEKVLLRQAGHLDATELARAGRHLVEVVDPDTVDRRLEAALERAGTCRAPDPVPLDQPGPRRRRQGPGPRDGRGRRPAPRRPAAAHLPRRCPRPSHRPGRPGRSAATLATTAPGSGTPWSPPPTTRSTPACRPRPTAPPPDCSSPSTSRPSRATWRQPGSAPPPTAPNSHPKPCAGSPVTPRLIPAVLGTHGEVLDLGRLRRPVTTAIWTALILRDRHCTFPACRRPPLMCHAHHITPLGRRWRNQPRQPRPLMRPPSPDHPPHALADTPQSRRIEDPNSNHHPPSAPIPPGSDIDHEWDNRASWNHRRS